MKVFLILVAALGYYLFVDALIASLGLGLSPLLSIIVTLLFIIIGVGVIDFTSKKNKQITLTNGDEVALKYRKKINRYFIGVTLLCWILGFLIQGWIPGPIDHRTRSYNSTARVDLRNLYKTAQSYYAQNPDGSFNLEVAEKYSFKPSFNVKLTLEGVKQNNFKATAMHPGGNKVYSIDNKGVISETKSDNGNQGEP